MTARRLCDRAEAGQILCSSLVAELLASRQAFSFKDVGELDLKGLAAPVRSCEVIYARNDPMALLTRTPFVGRTHQMERLLAKLDLACSGRGSVAMLVGEPGIGKTRTLEEFTDFARERGATVLRGACYDGEFQRPYGPFAEAIAEYARTAPAENLKAALAKNAPTIARMVPGLSRHLGDISDPPALDKEEERFRLLDAVAQSLIVLAQTLPLVLILDDLHWADRGTVAMLAHVAHFVTSNPIMLIGAYRDGEVSRRHPLSAALSGIRRLRDFESVALKGLEGGDVAELLGMIADQDAPVALVKAISAETDGNPLFIREVLLHLMEEGKILREGQAWTSKLSIEELGFPEGVRDVIGRRLLRISAEGRELLRVGAAFNGVFSFGIATAVAQLDEQTALDAFDEALDAHLVRPGVSSETFDFTHALIRNTLYSELSPPRRVRLHRKIAEAMELVWGELAREHAAEVAYQYWRGASALGSERRGVDYAIAAADNAEAAYAHAEVAAFLNIALDLLPRADPRRSQLLARQGLALIWNLDADEGVKVAREAGDLIATTESAEAAADYLESAAFAMHTAGLRGGSWELARAGLRYIGERRDITWAGLREIDLMREAAEDPENPGIRVDTAAQRELREILRSIPTARIATRDFAPPLESREEIIHDPHSPPSTILFLAGDYRRGLATWQQEAADAERRGRIGWAVKAWADVASAHIALGEFAAALAACDRASALEARATGSASGSTNMDLMSARHELRIALDQGWEQVLEDAAASSLIDDPSAEDHWAFAMVRACAAYVFARLQQPELSLQWLSSLPAAVERGAYWEHTYCGTICDAAASLWLLNRNDYSEVFERNIQLKVLPHDFRYPTRDSRLSLGRLCALNNRHDEASDWFAKAREVLDEQGARPLRANTDYDEGLMFLRRGAAGDTERARPFLDAASQQFQTLGMTGWIQRAEEARGAAKS